ncbi:MAG: hypothetical protein V1844_17115 [Pseudomonadota bacterium]
MNTKIYRLLKLSILIMIAAVSLTGCNGRFFTYKDATISQPDHVIQLQQGDQQDVWKTNKLALNYKYHMTPETLKIYGAVELVGGFNIGFTSTDRLVVQLLFLDNQGTVIDDVILYSADYKHQIHMFPMNFEKTFPVPDKTAAISFTYDGKLLDGGGKTATSIMFFPK